ncbi:MAG: Rrf2 family transcriptional regulator [Rickettsiaceae bacterium]
MIISAKSRYAITAILEIALISNQNKPVSLQVISKNRKISLNSLEQIFHSLRNANIVKSFKGPGGGYVINGQLDEINILSILDALNENTKMTKCIECKTSGNIQNQNKCYTHHLWKGLTYNIREYFANISVGDIVTKNIIIN